MEIFTKLNLFKKKSSIDRLYEKANKSFESSPPTHTQLNFYLNQPEFDDILTFIVEHLDPKNPEKAKEIPKFFGQMPEQKRIIYELMLATALKNLTDDSKK